MTRLPLDLVAGARPNFVKVAPLHDALAGTGAFDVRLVHTGQHFDEALSGAFLQDLRLPPPSVHLGAPAGVKPVRRLGAVAAAYEERIASDRPALTVVVGDVDSTLACALASSRAGVPLAHVEAGLRSGDWTMPEEANRVLTDRLARWCFAPSEDAVANLVREGVAADRIHFVGNVMIDTLRREEDRIRRSDVLHRIGLARGAEYLLATLHRPASVDDPSVLHGILAALEDAAQDRPVVLPLHPRGRKAMPSSGIAPASPGLRITEPLPYHDFLHLLGNARLVLTDSGGVQEEALVLGVRCLTLRTTTERPITLRDGANRIVGTEPPAVRAAIRDALALPRPEPWSPPLWDGKASLRIAATLRAQCP